MAARVRTGSDLARCGSPKCGSAILVFTVACVLVRPGAEYLRGDDEMIRFRKRSEAVRVGAESVTGAGFARLDAAHGHIPRMAW